MPGDQCITAAIREPETVRQSSDSQYLIVTEGEVIPEEHSFTSDKFLTERLLRKQIPSFSIKDKYIDRTDLWLERVGILHIILINEFEIYTAIIHIVFDLLTR